MSRAPRANKAALWRRLTSLEALSRGACADEADYTEIRGVTYRDGVRAIRRTIATIEAELIEQGGFLLD